MGSMCRMMLKLTGSETCTKSNSAHDDKIKDHAENVVEADDKKDVNEECSADKFAEVKDLKEVCSSSHCPVPTRPRTPRFCIGVLTIDPEGVYHYRSADEVIADEDGLRKSGKRSRDENCDGCVDDFEESLGKEKQQDCVVSEEDRSFKMKQKDCVASEYCCSTDQVIVNDNGSRNRSRDENYRVCYDGFEEEQSLKKNLQQDCNVFQEGKSSEMKQQDCVVSGESSKKKRREYVLSEEYVKESCKKVEQNRTFLRKVVKVYNLETDLPQNLKEYINALDLKAPPLFVAQKLLTATDVDSHQSRLLLPNSLINAEFFSNFLTEAEKEMLTTEAVKVNVVDDKLRESYGLRLAKWTMTSSLEYALRRGWNTVVGENNLEPLKLSEDSSDRIAVMKDGDLWKTDVVVLAWCFRRKSEIWLALHTQAMVELDILGVGENSKGKRYIIG